MPKELLSPLVSVDVLPAKDGERVLVPSQWRRHIFAEEWSDMLSMRRVSSVGGITGGFASTLALTYLCSSADDPARLNEENFPDYPYKRFSTVRTKFTVQLPDGYDAILVDAPIRGVMPAPVVTNVRIAAPTAAHDYEDLTPEKYAHEEFILKNGGIVGLHPTTGLLSLYSSISVIEVPNPDGTKRVYPILQETGRVVELSILGFRGSYLLATPIGVDIYELCTTNGAVARDRLLADAQHNTQLMLSSQGRFFLPTHPGAKYYTVDQNCYVYNALAMRPISEGGGGPNVVPDYRLYTTASLYLETPPSLAPDFSFMFVLQLSTPESQLYHLYSHTSVVRIFFGGHYMLDFVPGGSAGVSSAYFYFFPYGYYVDSDVISGARPVANEFALVGGQAASLSYNYGIFHLGAYPPRPVGERFYSPFVFVKPISEMELWNLSRVSPGATAEAFLVTCLKGHLCIFRYSDLMAATRGDTVRPIFAFNPLEYVRRHFGADATLLQHFSSCVIPSHTSVGMVICNANAYISFADFFWRGYSIATLPTVIAPPIDDYPNIVARTEEREHKVYYYYPTQLVGVAGNPPMKLRDSPMVMGGASTAPPDITPVSGASVARRLVSPFVYPLVYAYESRAAAELRAAQKGTPSIIAEVYEESGVSVGAHASTLSVVCSFPSEAIAPYFNYTPGVLQNRTRTAQNGFCGTIPSLDWGIAPHYFPNWESWESAYRNKIYLQTEPTVLYEARMPSLRFPLSPPTLHACDLVTVGLFTYGDHNWETATDLAAHLAEAQIGGVVSAVSVTLRGLGESSASITLQIPWQYNILYNLAPSDSDALILSLPPLLAYLLKPYNLVRIRMGYTLWGEGGVVASVSPVVFEGIIDSISARVTEQQAGARTLNVTINCTDIFARLAQSTVEYEPPLDGWFFPDVLEHHLINAGIAPNRISSLLWIPLGALSSFMLGESLFVGNHDAYYAYMDYPFRVDIGFNVLADAPRYQVTPGSRRLDVVRQAARLCGIALYPTPYPIDTSQLTTFLDFVLSSQTYERFMPTLAGLVARMKEPYVPSLIGGTVGMYVQALPVGSYALRPTWNFYINTTTMPDAALYPPESIFVAKVLLPDSPFVHGVFSLSLDAAAYQLPTLIRVEGRRLSGQPFYYIHHDYWSELVDVDGYRFKGFRIASTTQRNQNIVEPIQALLAAWRAFLSTGYFPPIRCTMSVFGIPNFAPNHLIKVTPPLRIIGHETLIPFSQYGLQYWVVESVSYSFQAGNLPMAQLTLRPPHAFLVGLIGG